MNKIYENAFTEVYEILNYLEEDSYNKIPKEIIDLIEKNRNKEYIYYLDESASFSEQIMLPETKAILFNFFRDYLATKEQREKILEIQKKENDILEEEKKNKYNISINFPTENKNKIIYENTEEKSLIELKKNNFFSKIINLIKKLRIKN